MLVSHCAYALVSLDVMKLHVVSVSMVSDITFSHLQTTVCVCACLLVGSRDSRSQEGVGRTPMAGHASLYLRLLRLQKHTVRLAIIIRFTINCVLENWILILNMDLGDFPYSLSTLDWTEKLHALHSLFRLEVCDQRDRNSNVSICSTSSESVMEMLPAQPVSAPAPSDHTQQESRSIASTISMSEELNSDEEPTYQNTLPHCSNQHQSGKL